MDELSAYNAESPADVLQSLEHRHLYHPKTLTWIMSEFNLHRKKLHTATSDELGLLYTNLSKK